jgi:GT2 family glycosyltransferase
LVDNGSTDGSVQIAKTAFPDKIQVVTSKVNLGFVKGNNLAIPLAKGDYVVLLNDDTIVDQNWLSPLVNVAESDDKIGACQPKLMSLRQQGYFEYNGAAGGLLDVYGVPLTRGRLFETAELDIGQYDTMVEVFWASGAALFARKCLIVKAGFLDELLHAHMEEIDLSWKLRLMGYSVVSVPSSIVFHLGGNTPIPSKLYLKQRNNLIILLKNYSYSSLIRYLPARMVLDGLSIWYSIAGKDKRRPWTVIAAYLWAIRNLKMIFKSRQRSQAVRAVSDSSIISAMLRRSVAIQYYLLKRRRFGQLSGLPLPPGSYARNTPYPPAKQPLLVQVV